MDKVGPFLRFLLHRGSTIFLIITEVKLYLDNRTLAKVIHLPAKPPDTF